MTKRVAIFCTAVLVVGYVRLTSAVAGTDLGNTATVEAEIRELTISATTAIVPGMDGQAQGSANERIEIADRGSRFSETSLRKKDGPVAADADKTNPSPDTMVDIRKKEALPSLSSGPEVPERSDTTAAILGAAEEQARSKDGDCAADGVDIQGGEVADAAKTAGKTAVGGKASKKKMKLGKKKCKKAMRTPKKKQSKPLSARGAEEKAQAGLERAQKQTQSGLREVVGNVNRAAQMADKLAPEVGPSPVSEDHLDLGSSDDLGE